MIAENRPRNWTCIWPWAWRQARRVKPEAEPDSPEAKPDLPEAKPSPMQSSGKWRN